VRVRHHPNMENASKTLEELRKLPVDQRIQLVEDLWDTIADDTLGESIAVSPELAAELDRRLQEYRSDPETARPVEDVLARLRGLVRDRTE
jgi:putative addiction module component (TIGR02574 family)